MRAVILPLTLLGVAALSALSVGRPQQAAPKARIGIYESRAVAVAYASSPFNPVREKMREYEQAKAAGDTARVTELESWGRTSQRALHRQGFGRVPVDDLLAHVADHLPEVASAAGVEAIVFDCTWAGPGVEVVDVTDALVALFDPSEKTLAAIAEIKNHEPLDLEEIEQHQDDM